MANLNALNALYSKRKSALEFNFDILTAPPLLSLLNPQDIFELNRIARSVKLSGKIDEKYKLIDMIMTNRGFVKLHAGTNRVVYRFLEDQRFVIKVAIDRVGLGDNPAEFQNQFLLKPFVTKVFEVSPCGTVAIVERVDAIMSREEFISVADDIFNLITKFFVGKYILEDFGTHFFMNWAVRKGFGPVLLDFPYVYELDGNKLFCNAKPFPNRRDIICGGELDYDDGFNNLICTKCGREYQARDLQKAQKDELIIVGGKKTMNVRISVGNEVIWDSSKRKVSKVITPNPNNVKVSGLEEKPKVIEAPISDDTKIETKEDISKVESRTNIPKEEHKEQSKQVPKDTIFKKKGNEEMKKIQKNNMHGEIENNEYSLNNDFEDDDYQDYDQYLSNRERSNIRKEKKQHRKGNNNYDGF